LRDFRKIAIVGSPNVGKSVLFNNLTGRYVMVSNYPGTTVEVVRGKAKVKGVEYELIDTPGMYSLFPITEDERVARSILLDEEPGLIIHVVDAKNMERMLHFTIQLIEACFSTVLVLNMLDEAEKEGVEIDIELLEEELGIPVVGTVSTTGRGIDRLKETIDRCIRERRAVPEYRVQYSAGIEKGLAQIENLLDKSWPISRRSLALLLLKEDRQIREAVREKAGEVIGKIEEIIEKSKSHYINPIEYEVAIGRRKEAGRIANKTMKFEEDRIRFNERLSRLTMNPITGLPILFFVLYWGLYKFVGGFGAGTVVDFLEGTVFEKYINPFVVNIFSRIIPWEIIQELFAGEYGVITLGVRYAVALILPIVTFFFIVFSVIEDTGYLPRLAMLIDRTFKKIGLSGRAVIPIVLGFGCDTMATMVTRTLATRRERLISTMLLALAVPCSAQLGVILALLEGRPAAVLIWAGVVALIFLFVGYLTAKILPGERPIFYMEVPPLRLPKLSNVLIKTYVRVKWYFKEILPLFLLASVLIWLGQLTGLFDLLVGLLRKPVELVGLPPDAAKIFLLGFFRRDYGAAGLYDLNKEGILSGVQLVVACVALTLFLPCIAQLLMNVKERGIKTGLGISVFVLFLSFTVAFVLNLVLTRLGAVL